MIRKVCVNPGPQFQDYLVSHDRGKLTRCRRIAAPEVCSAGHFGRCFRLSFGVSVHQRLIQLRIERAKELLSRTNKTLVEIALLSGFCDQAALSRTFSRIEHMTP